MEKPLISICSLHHGCKLRGTKRELWQLTLPTPLFPSVADVLLLSLLPAELEAGEP